MSSLTKIMISADAIVERACETAQLEDFGSDSFREGLEVLVRGADDEREGR